MEFPELRQIRYKRSEINPVTTMKPIEPEKAKSHAPGFAVCLTLILFFSAIFAAAAPFIQINFLGFRTEKRFGWNDLGKPEYWQRVQRKACIGAGVGALLGVSVVASLRKKSHTLKQDH